MRVLIVGGGGREHALAWRFKHERPDLELFAAPGNPGIAELGKCLEVGSMDLAGLERTAREHAIDLTVVGPEAPLAEGLVDRFREAGLVIFGPTAAAAQIETSKAFAKELMLDAGIPTARAEMYRDPLLAKAAAREFGAPVVIKASGLASGKGVIVCETAEEADSAIDDMLSNDRFGDAGLEVLVEEFMEGEELSVFAVTNGKDFVILPPLQDHKRLLDNDLGPNTGGMGAYAPVSVTVQTDQLVNIFEGTLAALAERRMTFTGLLYAGLMLTRDGPKVVEFNCRFGDPETQALMPLLSDEVRLLDLILASAQAAALPEMPMSLRGKCVTTVLAAPNYPQTPRTGTPISLPAPEAGVFVFHAGTKRDAGGALVTAGGRVLAVSAVADTMEEAQQRSREVASRVSFDGKQMRSDIGWREIARAPGN